MPRPTIHPDGTPLTPYERVKRHRTKKRADAEERLHDALQWAYLRDQRASYLAEIAEGVRLTDMWIAADSAEWRKRNGR